jgi:hypothetical protein
LTYTSFDWLNEIVRKRRVFGKMFIVCINAQPQKHFYCIHHSNQDLVCFFFINCIKADSSFTAGGKIDLKNYDFPFIFCRPNLLSIRHIISKNEIYKLIRSNFAIFSIMNCLIQLCSIYTLRYFHTILQCLLYY